jgi:hypothetical protein
VLHHPTPVERDPALSPPSPCAQAAVRSELNRSIHSNAVVLLGWSDAAGTRIAQQRLGGLGGAAGGACFEQYVWAAPDDPLSK